MAPDTSGNQQAAESWENVKEGVIGIMVNTQEISRNMHTAAMKIAVVNNYTEKIESQILQEKD